MMRSIPIIVALALLAGCDSVEQAHLGSEAPTADAGLTVTHFPSEEDPGFPFYARTEPHILYDGEWAAIVFYRGPMGIPADFNLLQFFHFPDPGPGAFAVPLNVSGKHFWQGEPFAAPPKMSQAQGDGAVPIWFLPAAALLSFIDQQGADPVLTVGDLAAMPGRIDGFASQFNEVLHPHPDPGGLGGHTKPKLNMSARGLLDDGRTFQLNVNGKEGPDGPVHNTRIRFR